MMNKWLFRFLTVLGPAFVMMSAMTFLAPDDGIPEPFWTTGFALIMSSVMISVPQIVWSLICFPCLLSKEVYWGGLITVQLGLIVYGIWNIAYLHSHSDGESIWFLYFPLCVLLIPFGALCGFLFRKFRHKEPAA